MEDAVGELVVEKKETARDDSRDVGEKTGAEIWGCKMVAGGSRRKVGPDWRRDDIREDCRRERAARVRHRPKRVGRD